MNQAINSLPLEIFRHVLGFLSLSEFIEKKLVCKLWNELISSQLKVTRLIVDSYNHKERWWHVHRPVNEYLEVCHPNLFVAQLQRPILANLRHLKFNVFSDLDDLNPNDLNAFAKLVHLEVNWTIMNFNQIEWILPNLKILKIVLRKAAWQPDRPFLQNQLQVWIDCPKLKVLAYEWGENFLFDLRSPETITTLYANLHDSKLAKFKNTETYKYSGDLSFVDDALIRQLPKLKVLEIHKEIYELSDELETVDAVKQFLKRLLRDKRKVLRSDLKFFFAGAEIRGEALVDKLDLQMIERDKRFHSIKRLSIEHLYFGNYPADCQPKLLNELELAKDVDYQILMGLVNKLPKDYFKRFFNIQSVITSGDIQDPDHFASYLNRLEHLDNLEMRYPSLTQEWYDQLPTICKLKFFYLLEKDEIELDFDFLGLFEQHIRSLSVNRDLSLKSAKSLPNLFRSFKVRYVRKFRFKLRGVDVMIRIRKSGQESDQSDSSEFSNVELSDDYDVLVNKKLKLKRANSMEILDYIERLEKESQATSVNSVNSVNSQGQ